MKKLFLPLALIFFQFAVYAFGVFSWPLFSGLLALVVMFAFFHNLDVRDTVFMAVVCGVCVDVFGLNAFGSTALVFVLIALAVSFATRLLNRHNGMIVFPVIFIASLLQSYMMAALRPFFADTAATGSAGLFFSRSFVQAALTTALSIPLYLFSRSCGLRPTES